MTIPLHTVPGTELPDLLWYHREAEDAAHVQLRFRPAVFDGWRSKPEGGLWAAVLSDFAGSSLSDWGDFERSAEVKGHRYVSRLVPEPDTRFVVIDSAADGAAVAQAFPGVEGEGTLHKLLAQMDRDPGPKAPTPVDMQGLEAKVPSLEEIEAEVPESVRRAISAMGSRGMAPLVDFTLLAQHQYAGVYLTDRGRMECRLPLPPGVPDLWGWDVECVWFRSPELRVEDTRRWEPV